MPTNRPRLLRLMLAATLGLVDPLARAEQAMRDDEPPLPPAPTRAATGVAPDGTGARGRVELRRENVDRGTTEETTKTFVRLDLYDVWGGTASLQVPFPDERTDFAGSPFSPRLGDVKTRFRFPYFRAGAFDLSSFVEATFPTADPKSLGTGKYQVSAGITATTPLQSPRAMGAAHRLTFTSQLQQTNDVAGDPERAHINYTKWDFNLRDNWGVYWVRGAVNTRVDWEQRGKTGAVGELEIGRSFEHAWRLWLMAGHLLWGEGVRGTYGSKVMLGFDRRF